MTPVELDYYFPFVVLFYGLIVTFILHSDFFMNVAKERLTPALIQQIQGHRILALISLVVGGGWALQNLFVA